MKVLIILEFGKLQYRESLFEMIRDSPLIEKLEVITHDDNPDTITIGPFKWLRRFVIYTDFDVVVYSFNLYRPIFLRTLWKKKPATLLWGHGYSTRNKRRLIVGVRNFLIKRSNGLLLYTGESKSRIERATGHKNIQVLNNTLLVKNATNTEFDSSEKRLVYVGRIQERKRLDLVVEILEVLNKQPENNISLRIVGEDMCSFKNRYPASKYTFLEYFDATYHEDELLEHFEKSWAYISPCQVGLGVNHSFAYGCPVVTLQEAKHGPEFFYCDHSNSFLTSGSELKNTIEHLFSNVEEVRKKGNRAFQFFNENLTSHSFVNEFLKAIKNSD